MVGCRIVKLKHDERKFTFAITHESRKPVKIAAEDEDSFNWWTKTLARAAIGALGKSTIDFDPYYEILGLDKNEKLTSTLLSRAFRKKGITMHPDKEGGSEESFRKVQEAYDMLVSKVESDELASKYEDILYTASINKGVPKVGFGMIVVEDPKTHHIIVKSVLKTMKLEDIEESANGEILEGDRLMKIQSDDVSEWTLARVVQRLGDLRCPIGSTVELQFSRKVLKDGETVNSAEGNIEASDIEKSGSLSTDVENDGDKEDTIDAIAEVKSEKNKRRQSVADTVYTSTGSSLTDSEILVAEKPPRYSSHGFGDEIMSSEITFNESESDDGIDVQANPPSAKPFPAATDPITEAAKELEMLRKMNSDMEASVSELESASGLVVIPTEKDRECSRLFDQIVDAVASNVSNVDELMPRGECMKVLGTQNCVAQGIDVIQRNALIAGVATMGWTDESTRVNFLEDNCRDQLNNLNVLNDTLKGYELKQKMKSNSSKAIGTTATAASSSNGPKRTLFKSRLSIIMNK